MSSVLAKMLPCSSSDGPSSRVANCCRWRCNVIESWDAILGQVGVNSTHNSRNLCTIRCPPQWPPTATISRPPTAPQAPALTALTPVTPPVRVTVRRHPTPKRTSQRYHAASALGFFKNSCVFPPEDQRSHCCPVPVISKLPNPLNSIGEEKKKGQNRERTPSSGARSRQSCIQFQAVRRRRRRP